MSNICGVCHTEKVFDNERNIYKRCAPCNRKKVLKHYYNNKEAILERNKNRNQNKKQNKIRELENQVKQLTETIQNHTCIRV